MLISRPTPPSPEHGLGSFKIATYLLYPPIVEDPRRFRIAMQPDVYTLYSRGLITGLDTRFLCCHLPSGCSNQSNSCRYPSGHTVPFHPSSSLNVGWSADQPYLGHVVLKLQGFCLLSTAFPGFPWHVWRNWSGPGTVQQWGDAWRWWCRLSLSQQPFAV